MKKVFFLTGLLAAGMAFNAGAQVLVGAEVGISASSIKYETYGVEINGTEPSITRTKDHKDFKVGPRAGLTFDIPFGYHYALEVGMQYAMKGYTQRDQKTVLDVDYITKANYTFHYAEVPVNFVVRLGGGYSLREFQYTPVTHFTLYAGPYVAYGFSGKGRDDSSKVGNNKADETSTTHDIEFGSDVPSIDPTTFKYTPGSEISDLDYGFQVGAGVEFPFGLYVKGQYQMGLANLSNGFINPLKLTEISAGYLKNYSISLMVGYWLNY